VDQYYTYWQRLITNKEMRSVFQPIWSDVSHVWTRDIFREVFPSHISKVDTPEDCIYHSLYFEAKTFLHGLLVVEDKLSMAHGLESRVPFLDNDLVDFAMRLPVHLKLAHLGEIVRLNENEPGKKPEKYYRKTRDGKLLLRKVMEQYIPAEITKAVKQGFSAPDASWFKGESINYVQESILSRNARIYEFFHCDTITELVNQHIRGEKNRRLLIWSLLSFEEWLKKFL